jgi:hypothetical protein
MPTREKNIRSGSKLKFVNFKMSTHQNPEAAFWHLALDYQAFINHVNRFNERLEWNINKYLARCEAVNARMDQLTERIEALGVQNQILRQRAKELRRLLDAKEGK